MDVYYRHAPKETIMKLDSETCLRAANDPSSVSINTLKSICTLAYGRLWREEQDEKKAKQKEKDVSNEALDKRN